MEKEKKQKIVRKKYKVERIKKSSKLIALLPVAIFAVIASTLFLCVNTIEKNNSSEAETILKEAVSKAAVHCYAVEGAYPETLEYLEDNYGLNYNKDKFTVHYTSIGSNIMPDIFIVRSYEDEGN